MNGNLQSCCISIHLNTRKDHLKLPLSSNCIAEYLNNPLDNLIFLNRAVGKNQFFDEKSGSWVLDLVIKNYFHITDFCKYHFFNIFFKIVCLLNQLIHCAMREASG